MFRRKKINPDWLCPHCKKRFGEYPVILPGGDFMKLCTKCRDKLIRPKKTRRRWWK